MRDEAFEKWFSSCHPWDWYARENSGEPLPTGVRLEIWGLLKAAWNHENVGQRPAPQPGAEP